MQGENKMSLIGVNTNFFQNFNSLHVFVTMIFIVWLIIFYYSLKIYGVKKTIRYFFPITIASIIGELCAIANGDYQYPNYLFYINALGGSLPIIIGLGWSVNLFLCMHLGKDVATRFFKEKNFKQIFYISVFAGLFGLFLDLLEDPLAHHNSWWIWSQIPDKLYLFNVSLTNFFGWFVILAGMTMLTLLIDRSRYSENRKVLINITMPLIFLILLPPYFYFT